MSANIPRSVEALDNIYGVRFLVRAGFNVPIVDGEVQDTHRIEVALLTIKYLIERGARVIILTHVGRDPGNSTKPLLKVLNQYVPTNHVDAVVGEKAYGAAMHMKEGTVLLLENLRSCDGEIKNDESFAQTLATYGNFYVNEAFSDSHREHASIVTLPKLLPNFAGFSLLQEQKELTKALSPVEPSLCILGGAKFETKEPLIEKYSNKYTNVFVGGAIANDFFRAKEYEVGTSLLSGVDLSTHPLMKKENILLPTDVIATREETSRQTEVDKVQSIEKIVDVGTNSIEMLAPYIKKAKTILWNGPLGNYEEGFDEGTKLCAKLVAESGAFSIVGGGDTVAAIKSLHLEDSFSFLSAGGGAMLTFLEQGTLPGIEVLTKS
jgi:phosphoglycerate kinase